MIPFHNAMSIVGVSGPSVSYAQWVTQATAMASIEVNWAYGTFGGSAGRRRVTCGSPGGYMTGTPWASANGFVYLEHVVSRVAQHCFPTEAIFNEQCASGRVVVLGFRYGTPKFSVAGLNRNGYNAPGRTADPEYEPNGFETVFLDEFWYYDPELGPMKMLPSSGLGPSPYTW